MVLPTPLTPEIKIIFKFSFFSKKFFFSSGSIRLIIYSSSILLTSLTALFFGSIFFRAIISFISEEASIPTSELIKNSSISSNVLSSISFLIIISLRPEAILSALFLNPILNFSKIPMKV